MSAASVRAEAKRLLALSLEGGVVSADLVGAVLAALTKSRAAHQLRPLLRAYLANISYADHCLGLVFDALAKSKYADNTIVMIWGDHGWHLGEKLKYGKTDLWEESDRVPFIVSVPGVTIRTTSRSTGPLLVAGSPICSQIATDTPCFTSLAK